MKTIHDCGRCGASMSLHWSKAEPHRRFTGCPFPVGFLQEPPACGFLHCTNRDDVDDVLGLCPEHLARAERGLATRAW